jgi:hypothetical protein
MKYHDHSSNQTYSPGFIFNMHPDFHSRMEMKNVLESHLENIEVSLVPNSDFYLTNANGVEQKVYVKVVEVHVAANQTSEARQGLAKAFDENDPDLANKEFIPRPQRGIMPIETYRAALAEHRSLTTDQRSFSITGVKDMDNACMAIGNSTYPLKEYILTKIIGKDKKPIFNDITPTKMVKEGRFLLLTHKDKMDEAQEAIDAFTSWLDKTGQQTTLAHPGKKIKRTNPYSTGPRFSKHANKITAKFSLTAAAPPAPPPTNNPWNGNNKRTVQLVVGNTNEFPPLANATSNDEHGTSKKQKSNKAATQSSSEDSQADADDLTYETRHSEHSQRLKDIEEQTNKELAELRQANKSLREEHTKERIDYKKNQIEYEKTLSDLQTHLKNADQRTDHLSQQISTVAKLVLFLATHTSGAPPIPLDLLESLNAPPPVAIPPSATTQSSDTNDADAMDIETELARSKRGAGEMN